MPSSVQASCLPTDMVAALVVQSPFCVQPRLFAHLTDSRRTKCLEWCMSNAALMESEEIQQLDIIDRDLRSQARRAGHTQPRSTARAVGQNRQKMENSPFNDCVQKRSFAFILASSVRSGFIKPTRQ